MRDVTANEPAVTVAGITAAVSALIALGIAFGLPITDDQTAAILGVVAVVGPLVVGFVTRGKVSPTAAEPVGLDDPDDDDADDQDEDDDEDLVEFEDEDSEDYRPEHSAN